MDIVRPRTDLFEAFQEFVSEMKAHGETLWSPYLPKDDEEAHSFVERLLKRSVSSEEGFVSETIFWAVEGERVIGRISLRHKLQGNLHKIGGHIGYEVRPSFRRKGMATEMLRQVLLTDKALEIGELLLTCSPENIASNKTIVSNGGILKQRIFVESVNQDRNHYWINLRKKTS